MLETASSGGSPLPLGRGFLDSGLSARADETSRSQGRETRHPHGSLSRLVGSSARRGRQREPERRETHRRSSMRRKSDGACSDSSPQDRPCACTACRGSEEPTFRRVVLTIVSLAEVGRTASSSWMRAANRETGAARGSETQRGATREARSIARPMEGAPDHQYLRRPFTGVVVRRWSWSRARRHLPIPVAGGGVSSGWRKPVAPRA